MMYTLVNFIYKTFLFLNILKFGSVSDNQSSKNIFNGQKHVAKYVRRRTNKRMYKSY